MKGNGYGKRKKLKEEELNGTTTPEKNTIAYAINFLRILGSFEDETIDDYLFEAKWKDDYEVNSKTRIMDLKTFLKIFGNAKVDNLMEQLEVDRVYTQGFLKNTRKVIFRFKLI